MFLNELDFSYPDRLIATARRPSSRVMVVENGQPRELAAGISDLLRLFKAGDCLVVNDTRVLKRRVFSASNLEILFLESQGDRSTWQVLCASSRWKDATEQTLPGGVRLKIQSRGRPQVVVASRPLDDAYFNEYGEMPLPPYIQKARGERHGRGADLEQYQSAWAKQPGSLAAPTASLHFCKEDLQNLRNAGIKTVEITLHVGLGTFLPITAENLRDHTMHAETVEISAQAWQTIEQTKATGGRIWAMGTTVARSLEAASLGTAGKISRRQNDGCLFGQTDLFIQPGFQFQMVDVLLTNFHQPRSTLLALVAAFVDLEILKRCYAWAIEREFQLFSYGDLTAWIP